MKKLIIAVVQNEDADGVVDALLDQDFRATRLASTGGFLRRGNTTLMIGADEDQVDLVLDLIRRNARSGAAMQDESGTRHRARRRHRLRARSRRVPAPLAISLRGFARFRHVTTSEVCAWDHRFPFHVKGIRVRTRLTTPVTMAVVLFGVASAADRERSD